MGSYNYYKMFGCFNRKFKISESEPPPDVREAFWRFTDGDSEMTPDQLLKFMVHHQREESCTVADVESIMNHVFQRRYHSDTRRNFTLEDFFYFLFQDDLNGPIFPKVHHDMTAPLHHYYIYTGHNSYLTGNQLSSDCSETPIAKALENGVRGIELDLWPNSAGDKVHVLHGRTLTTPVPLLKCLKSIKEHAFVKSPYPVIITLEDHLTPQLQAKVAQMATSTLGDMLYCPESGILEEFPSPESLKHKVILSTKPPIEYLGASNITIYNNSSPSPTPLPNEKESSDDDQEPEPDPDIDPGDKSEGDDEDTDSSNKKPEATEYKRLIAIHASNAKNKGLRQVLRVSHDRARRLSLSEQELERAASLYATDVVRFTQNHILRVFPKGARVNSSNFRPTIGWIHGAQMVAFNMQGYGKSLWMMQGMFRSNGGCGYLKKPDILMKQSSSGEALDPRLPWPVRKTLKVVVYMGDGWRLDFSHTHFDAFSPPDFYTKIYIWGVPADNAKRKTRIIEDDWAPYWDEEFKFPLRIPELALLRIEVREYDRSDKDDFGGQTSLLVSDLRPGFRAVPLYDKKGHKFKSVRLLLRFQFE